VEELTSGAFRETLDDPATGLDPTAIRRVLLCTGKIGHELIARRDEMDAPVAVVRVEQLYPWPEQQILEILDRYPNARQVWWVQEEPGNMGAWNFVHGKLHKILRDRAELKHLARPTSPSPASGSLTVHEREQEQLLAGAFTDLPG
jgi:2-oxoglutarate dehydrogenase E1 component